METDTKTLCGADVSQPKLKPRASLIRALFSFTRGHSHTQGESSNKINPQYLGAHIILQTAN